MAAKDGKASRGATSARERTFKTQIDIPAEQRAKLIEILNQQLADTFDLYSQIKQSHWNVKGKDFYQLHKLFDELAECALEWSDLIAERVTTLGGYAKGTVRMSAESSRLPEIEAGVTEGMDYVQCLVDRYASYCGTTREGIDTADEIGDPSTADLLTEVSRDADQNLYFLESHLQA